MAMEKKISDLTENELREIVLRAVSDAIKSEKEKARFERETAAKPLDDRTGVPLPPRKDRFPGILGKIES